MFSANACPATEQRYIYNTEIDGTTVKTWLQAQKCSFQKIKHIHVGRYMDGQKYNPEAHALTLDSIYCGHVRCDYTLPKLFDILQEQKKFTHQQAVSFFQAQGLALHSYQDSRYGKQITSLRMMRFDPKIDLAITWRVEIATLTATAKPHQAGTHVTGHMPLIRAPHPPADEWLVQNLWYGNYWSRTRKAFKNK
ncbi:MAG: hypothetical protein Alpg2KO_12930 [Alphaproteobacteria bacterium]